MGWLRASPVVHPVPSTINAVLVAALALIAGGGPSTAAGLALAMLGFQFSIGAVNDIADVDADRQRQPGKPIPAGRIGIGAATGIAVAAGAVGLLLSAGFGVAVLLVGTAGYACGLAYDLFMRRIGLGWLCFAAAIPLLLVWTWLAAAGSLPPGWILLLPMAALAGPTLHLANSLVDVGADDPTTRPSLATRLGLRRARVTLTLLMGLVLALAWLTLASMAGIGTPAVIGALVATITAAAGVALSWRDEPKAMESGWLLQAIGLAAMAAAWLGSVAA
jgi:4-hydroxybenzoate polyprenyltransferase